MSRLSFAFMRGIIQTFYHDLPGNLSGGSLSLVLEDHLYEDEWVNACMEYAAKHRDPDGVFLAALLLQFTESERREIIELETRA